MTISNPNETLTVKELMEILKKLPDDYRVDVSVKCYNNGDYGDRWLDVCTNDIDALEVDDKNKIVTIKAWE